MAKQSRNTLKGYFETGDIPTGANYVDLIDTPLMLDTENTGSAVILGSMTASGGISASKIVTPIVENSDTTVGLTLTGNITASGNISASGYVQALKYLGPNTVEAEGNQIELDSAGEIRIDSAGSFTQFSTNGTNKVSIHNVSGQITASGNISASGNLILDGNITASGDISASGIISAFGSSSLVGLPTTEPSITGALWLSGSGGGSASGSKYLMVFTG